MHQLQQFSMEILHNCRLGAEDYCDRLGAKDSTVTEM
jgi:hypothetical protein